MAVNDKTDVVVTPYSRTQYPVLDDGLRRYFQDELQRIEAAIRSLVTAAVQVTDDPPENPIKGMVRYAASPWDPLNNGYEGLVVYDGTNWVQV